MVAGATLSCATLAAFALNHVTRYALVPVVSSCLFYAGALVCATNGFPVFTWLWGEFALLFEKKTTPREVLGLVSGVCAGNAFGVVVCAMVAARAVDASLVAEIADFVVENSRPWWLSALSGLLTSALVCVGTAIVSRSNGWQEKLVGFLGPVAVFSANHFDHAAVYFFYATTAAFGDGFVSFVPLLSITIGNAAGGLLVAAMSAKRL